MSNMSISDPIDNVQKNLEEIGDLQTKLKQKVEFGSKAAKENIPRQFTHCKGTYTSLKNRLILLQTKLNVLQTIPTAHEDDVTGWQDHDNEYKTTAKEVREAKEGIEDLKDSIASLLEKTEKEYEAGQCILTKLEQQCDRVQAKQKKLDDLLQQRKNMLKDITTDTACDFNTIIQAKKAEVAKRKKQLSSLQKTLMNYQQTQEEIIEFSKQYEEAAKEYLGTIALHTRWNQKQDETRREHVNRIEYVCHQLRMMNGVHIDRLDDWSIRVALDRPPSAVSSDQLHVTMHFKLDGIHSSRLCAVKVSIDSLDVDDVVQNAITSNDVTYLIIQLQQRWHRQYSLLQEINQLRDRYAIDWISDEGLLRIMLGDGGHVVCTLAIQDGYPATSCISLTSITGAHDGLLDIEAFDNKGTLTQWLDFLAAKYNS